jgi:flagellar basal-body rod modification protein FlgD
MGTAAGIFNHQMTAGQALTTSAATPAASTTSGASSTSGSSDSSDNSATISANDFLTLLVTEMQNQDPTSDTDPNEYINQLVNVNSLEQLIDINQTLTADSTSGTSGTGATPAVAQAGGDSPAALPSAAASTRPAAHVAASPLSAAPASLASNASAPQTASTKHFSGQQFSGNLSAPNPSPAARRVGHALDGRTHAASVGGTSPGTQ